MPRVEQDLGQIFDNNSNCYADTEDDSVVLAMDKEQFVKVVSELLTECCLSKEHAKEKELELKILNKQQPKCQTY